MGKIQVRTRGENTNIDGNENSQSNEIVESNETMQSNETIVNNETVESNQNNQNQPDANEQADLSDEGAETTVQSIDVSDIENLGIGGGNDALIDNTTQNKTQMELDADYIKQNHTFIIPVQGTVTSGFGNREPTEIISAFHQGIDIGAVTGTSIYASMEGTVIASSYAGDYGNHIKIQNEEVLTVYAHCSELNVSVGDYICQGQEIGKVGSTGKVTGPHLHFEIRRNNRYVDPSLIINF